MGTYLQQFRKLASTNELNETNEKSPPLIRLTRLTRSDIEPTDSEIELAEKLGEADAQKHFLGAVDLINMLHESNGQWSKWAAGDAVTAACCWWNLELDQMEPIHWIVIVGYMTGDGGAAEVRSLGES